MKTEAWLAVDSILVLFGLYCCSPPPGSTGRGLAAAASAAVGGRGYVAGRAAAGEILSRSPDLLPSLGSGRAVRLAPILESACYFYLKFKLAPLLAAGAGGGFGSF